MPKTTSFREYWATAKIPLVLHSLRQSDLEAVVAVAKLAFLAGKRAGKKETT